MPTITNGTVKPGSGKMADSIAVLAKQELEQRQVSGFQREILQRTVESGSMSASDYENAWGMMKRCIVDRGYPRFAPKKTANGIYSFAFGGRDGSDENTPRFAEVHSDCQEEYVDVVSIIYNVQVGNPNLYADNAEAAVDCLHRENVVPKNYKIERFRAAQGSDKDLGFDPFTPEAQNCLVPNNFEMFDATKPED
ncbi:hypothetical protein [Bombiscardovia apis]|nr:hypothetical protein [Bombiscardovia apis]